MEVSAVEEVVGADDNAAANVFVANTEEVFTDVCEEVVSGEEAVEIPATHDEAPKETEETVDDPMDTSDPAAADVTLEDAVKEVSEGYQSAEEDKDASSPIVVYKGETKSVDFCPKCDTKFDIVRGGYCINTVLMEISIHCVTCDRDVIIRDAFDERERGIIGR